MLHRWKLRHISHPFFSFLFTAHLFFFKFSLTYVTLEDSLPWLQFICCFLRDADVLSEEILYTRHCTHFYLGCLLCRACKIKVIITINMCNNCKKLPPFYREVGHHFQWGKKWKKLARTARLQNLKTSFVSSVLAPAIFISSDWYIVSNTSIKIYTNQIEIYRCIPALYLLKLHNKYSLFLSTLTQATFYALKLVSASICDVSQNKQATICVFPPPFSFSPSFPSPTPPSLPPLLAYYPQNFWDIASSHTSDCFSITNSEGKSPTRSYNKD